jgi:predicted TIM-barrel fold metal-dependent hydrolase
MSSQPHVCRVAGGWHVTLDGWRRAGDGTFGWGVEGWHQFMDWAGISSAVVYPTVGLGYTFFKEPEWAADLARAYNDYVYHQYLKQSSRTKAVALIPVQDPAAAARELRRAVAELGMLGGLLPTPGLRRYYGDTAFDPLYREAQALGVMLAVHGAARQGIGLDWNDDPNQGFIGNSWVSSHFHRNFGATFFSATHCQICYLKKL